MYSPYRDIGEEDEVLRPRVGYTVFGTLPADMADPGLQHLLAAVAHRLPGTGDDVIDVVPVPPFIPGSSLSSIPLKSISISQTSLVFSFSGCL